MVNRYIFIKKNDGMYLKVFELFFEKKKKYFYNILPYLSKKKKISCTLLDIFKRTLVV